MDDQQRDVRTLEYTKTDNRCEQAMGNSLREFTLLPSNAAHSPPSSGPAHGAEPQHNLLGISAKVIGSKADSAASSEKQLCDDAEDRGYQAGKLEASEFHATESRRNAELVASVIEASMVSRREQDVAIQPRVIALSLKIAEKILCRQAEVDVLFLAASVRYAIDHMKTPSKLILKIAAMDHLDWLNLFGKMNGGSEIATIIIDPDLGPGMCRLESAGASADYSAAAQLAEIQRKFEGMLGESATAAAWLAK